MSLLPSPGGRGLAGMSLDQKRARVFGVLYLVTYVTSIPALLLYEPALRHPIAFVAGAGNVNRIYLGALLELLLIIANIGTAVVIVPIMRRQFEELSIGYVTARIVECTFILVGIVAILGLATLQQETAGAAEGTVAYTLAAIKDWTFLLGPGWVVGLGNGLILGYMMYRTGLVPRRATWLGLIGGPLIIISGTAILFSGNHPSSTLRVAAEPGDHPRVRMGVVPRRLLHDLGFQARCPDPFQERDLTTQLSPTPALPRCRDRRSRTPVAAAHGLVRRRIRPVLCHRMGDKRRQESPLHRIRSGVDELGARQPVEEPHQCVRDADRSLHLPLLHCGDPERA